MANRLLEQMFMNARVVVMALLVSLPGVMGGIPLGAAAQDEPAPTVGEIVVDSYDCDTGRLSFHVPVTDLPHIPDSNGPLGYSVSAQYEQGADFGLPAGSFNPEPQDSPYTGDVHLSVGFAPDGADSTSPESASGPIQSIDISVGVGYGRSDGPTDTSTATYPVDCGDANGDAENTDADGTTNVETGTNDGDLIPVCVQFFESAPSVQYLSQAQIDEIEATWAAYDESDIPPPQITGYPDPATGSCATENGVPIDYDPNVYTLICVPSGPEGEGPLVPQLAITHYLEGAEDVILADPDTGDCSQEDAAPGEGEDGATSDPASEDTAVEDTVTEGSTTEGDEGEANTTIGTGSNASETADASGDAATGGEESRDVSTLPATGTVKVSNNANSMALTMALGGIAVLLGFAAVRTRRLT